MLEPGKLLSTMDAKVWADEFMETKARLGEKEFDHAMMLGWFANAIMAGFDEATRRQKATIADLQGQVEAHKLVIDDHHRLVRELDVAMNGVEGAAKQASLCDLLSQTQALQQRVAQLEAGVNVCRERYDKLSTAHGTLQADHARVLGLVQAAREYIATIPARLHPDHSEEWKDGYQSAVYDVDQFLTGKQAASQPAQPAQGGANKPAGRMHSCDIPGCVSCGNPPDAEGETRA